MPQVQTLSHGRKWEQHNNKNVHYLVDRLRFTAGSPAADGAEGGVVPFDPSAAHHIHSHNVGAVEDRGLSRADHAVGVVLRRTTFHPATYLYKNNTKKEPARLIVHGPVGAPHNLSQSIHLTV